MPRDNFATISIPNAKFIFRTNFKGLAGPYNNEGERNFNVILEGDALEQAYSYGMNVKTTKPKDGYEDEAAVEKFRKILRLILVINLGRLLQC